ncbi:MAG: lactoylglutathione lyase [Mycobacterium sp.]|jgi:hypothetical protein|nr:lactoylglutathione lyase [Mycobacterium sp.]
MSAPVRTVVQIAWVTADLAATETALTNLLGVRKWVRIPEVHFAPDLNTYRGRPVDFVAGISMSYLGDMQLELIEPVRGGANIYSDFLDRHGAGLHHICVEAGVHTRDDGSDGTDDAEAFDAALTEAVGHGAEIVAQGQMPGGMRFAYLSNPDAGVPYLEIAHIPEAIRAFFDHIRQEQI